MSPSQACRDAGLKSLNELAEMTHQSAQTLINWHKHKPELFRIVLAGAAAVRFQERLSLI